MKKKIFMQTVALFTIIILHLWSNALIGAQEESDRKTKADTHVTLKAPLLSPKFSSFPVAVVNDADITLGEVAEVVASVHEDNSEDAGRTSGINIEEILKRIINRKLIIQEAQNMGLDERPEVKRAAETYAKQALRDQLFSVKTKDVTPDRSDVEKIYKELVREWKIRSVLFEKEEDAQKMQKSTTGGQDFDEAVQQALKEKKAEGGEEGGFMKPQDFLPQVAEALAMMKAGDVSPVIKVERKEDKAGYVVLKLLEIGYPESTAAREQAEQQAMGMKSFMILKKLAQSLLKKYGKINREAIVALDYDSPKPGIKKFLKDKRALATIKGEKPITVADLTTTLMEQYYHGIEQAIKEKRVNDKKMQALLSLLEKRLFRKEALRLKIDKSEEYLKTIRRYRESLLFSAFIEQAILPDIKVRDEDIQEYYAGNKTEFSSPAMIRLRGLAFAEKKQAEEAIEKLRKGADFNWLAGNAEGLLQKSDHDTVSFTGSLLTQAGLPEGVRKSVADGRPGDIRYYGSPEGQHYVLLIQQVVPPTLEPLAGAKERIAKKLHDREVKRLLEDWAKKLKESGAVNVYLMPASAK